MNNPLTVISGRSQLLAGRLCDVEHRSMALETVDQPHQLGGMIPSLRSFAEPVELERHPLDLADLVIREVQGIDPEQRRQVHMNTVFVEPLPLVYSDGELIATALAELVRNATQSKGVRHIGLRVQIDPLDDRLKIEVRDDGDGEDEGESEIEIDGLQAA